MSTDDESFHPLGSEWEDELETMLDDTEYDTDLGMQMAQDAMRVTKGELSEAEFHEMYHDEVMEEFGEDNRPTQEAFDAAKEESKGTMSRMLESFEGDGEESRRDTMKKMGAGAAAVGLGAWGTVDDSPRANVAAAQEDDEGAAGDAGDDDLQWGMTIDLERCDGCLTCVTACQQENDLDQGVNWMYVLAFEDEQTSSPSPSPEVRGGMDGYDMLVRPCQHCTDAPCEKVCPTTARHTRDKDGLVLTDYDVCIGCRYCQVACPYGVNYFQWNEPDVSTDEIAGDVEPGEEGDHMTDDRGRWVDARAPRGVMSKCTMCPTRQDGLMGEDQVGTTACEDVCPPDAIQFGNVNDERSDASQHRDNPNKSRSIIDIHGNIPSPDDIDEELDGDTDLEDALEALEIDSDLVAIMKAIEITTEGLDPSDENNSILEQEQDILESVDALEAYVDLEDEDVLAELRLGDGSESDAERRLRNYAGNPGSMFKLLDEYNTSPNVSYIGQEPGPNAEQVEGPVSYDGFDNLTDNRKDVVDEDTVTGGLY